MLIGKRFHFDAAHQHPHPGAGKCSNLHGHTYRVEIVLQGFAVQQDGPESGMLVDLGKLKVWWDAVINERVDHQNLNDVLPSRFLPSTIENIAAWILDEAQVAYPDVASVRVQEGETQWAIAIA